LKEEKEPEHCFKKKAICDQVTIPEKGTHEDMASAPSNQTSMKVRSKKLLVSYLAKTLLS